MSLEFELKFVSSAHRVPALRSYLRQVLRADPDHPAARVETIYFDTAGFDSLSEKVNSDYLKTKFRLRWYVDLETGEHSRVFAEIKRRVGSRRRKERLGTEWSGLDLSRQPLEHDGLRRRVAELALRGLDLPCQLYPMLHLRYRRERFVDAFTRRRISLDSEISLRRVHRGFLPAVPALPLPQALVEVKGAGRTLPLSLRMLPELGCRRGSFSKYGVCVERAKAPAA